MNTIEPGLQSLFHAIAHAQDEQETSTAHHGANWSVFCRNPLEVKFPGATPGHQRQN
ncbi:MAG: hypothetical protein HC773_15380, partial [Scytonema sp. CRU_2_7]|nr:hypothetical protein [Scytonema sp. CRU_2_7]